MKKIFIFLGLMFVMLSSTYAQKGRQAIGFGLSYGTEIESAGLGIKYQYNITNPLRIEPSFNYFFENDNVSMLVSIRPRACFFPLFSFLPLWLHYNLNP
ncbi:autotransporter outer membrane beta-barrel domain-containing protein, partial [Phocaeicola vulgatus]